MEGGKMRKKPAILIWLACFMLSASTAFALGGGEGYYFAFDNYMFRQPNADDATPSSYDSTELGGAVSGGNVSDVSTYAGVEFQREFNKVSEKADLHIGMGAKNLPEGGTVSLMQGDKVAVQFVVSNGNMALVTKRGIQELTAYDGFYGFKISVNIPQNTFSLMLNGKTVARNVAFLNDVEYLDKLYAVTPDEETGTFEFKHFFAYTGYIANEWFMGTHSEVPDDWSIIGTGVSVSGENISVNADNYGLKIEDSSYKSEAGISKDISYEADKLRVEYLFFTSGNAGDFGATLSANGDAIIRICADKLGFGYKLNGVFTKLYDMKPELWYDARLEIENGKASIYLNKKLLAEGIEIKNVKADNVKITVGEAATGKVYIDEIKVKEEYPLPEDYCPEPNIPEKNGDWIIGMQSCSLWREGSQMGWDFTNGYKERTPLIGFYDEGSPEVADWEIKWLSEHGVDYQMYCWFRQGGKNTPIQRPTQSWSLHDGYMESKHKDNLKFVVMWENHNATGVDGMEDWKKNLVPYWIEWYFKDPGCLVIDNKPVVAIYWMPKMLTDFGSLDGVREALDYLDEACRAEGFDGAYILFQADTRDPAYQEQYKYVGADAVFAYTAKTNLVAGQKAQFTAASAPGIFDVIASPGMGWDNTAWGINNRIGWNTKQDQLEILTWLRDEYMPSKSGIASKMITIDNWNEFNEGHWYYPTGLGGFDYIDAIREVFTKGGEHTDDIPSEEAQSRFQHLYVQDRKIPQHSVSRMLDKEEERKANYTSIKKYDFSDDEDKSNYVYGDMIDGFVVENGVAKGTVTDRDPKFYIKNANLAAANIKQIKVRARSTIESPSRFQIFFITDENPNWDEKKSFHTTLDNTGEWIELVMDTVGNSQLKGTITEMRVDPAELPGGFEVDYIEFFGMDSGADLLIDGIDNTLWRDVIYDNGTMYVPAVEYASGFGFNTAISLDGKTFRMLNDDTGLLLEFEVGKDAFVVDGEAYFPIRRVAEALGYTVEWDSEAHCANVITATEEIADGKEDPVGEWNFDIKNKYGTIYERGNVASESVKGGIYTFTAATNDPILRARTDIVAEEKPYINVRVRNKSLGNYFQVYYTTESEPDLSEDKSVRVKLTTNDKDFKNYTLDMSSSAKWKGKITMLRFDPIDAAGTMMIDYIRLSDKKIEADGGDGVSLGENLITEGMLYNKALEFTADNISAEWVTDEQYMGKYTIKLTQTDNGAMKIACANLVPGEKYRLSFWIKSTAANNLKLGFYGADGMLGGESYQTGSSPVWQKVQITLTAPEKAADGIYISPTVGKVYLDNLELRSMNTKSE